MINGIIQVQRNVSSTRLPKKSSVAAEEKRIRGKGQRKRKVIFAVPVNLISNSYTE